MAWMLLVPALWCAGASPAHAQAPAVKMTVAEPGIYLVTQSALAAKLGGTSGLDPRNFRVTHAGVELAVRVYNAEPLDSFDPGDAIEFYAIGIDRADPRYTHTDRDVYWLWPQGSGTPLRITEELSATPQSVPNRTTYTKIQREERDYLYAPALPLPEGAERWMWDDRLQAGSSIDFPFSMSHYAGGPVGVRIRLQGATNDLGTSVTDHSVTAAINDCTPYSNWQWDGFEAKVLPRELTNEACFHNTDFSKPPNLLHLTNQMIAGVTVNSVLLDWFEVTYERGLFAEFHYGAGDPGMLAFSLTGDGVPVDFYVNGFGSPVVELYDVTDPYHVRQVLPVPVGVAGTKSFYGMARFADDIGTETRHYFARGVSTQRLQPWLAVDTVADLANPANEGEYVIVTHPQLMDAANQLAAHRAGNGMRVKVVSTTDIYDEFAFGVSDPAAVRDFLTTALQNWAVPPLYVVLFGDATPTFKTATGAYKLNYGPNYVPTHLFTTQEGGVAPDDTWFVTGGNNDPFPDMFIGRLPVTPATAGGVVAKIIAYETQSDTSWTDQVQFAASWVDGSTVFEDHVNGMADQLPPEYAADRLLIGQMGGQSVRDALLANLDGGRLLTVFSGHGGGTQWANEKILMSDDMDALQNHAKLTFLLGFNCATGYFVEPFPQAANGRSLGEAGVVAAGGGAIGAWMAGWKGYVSDQQVMGTRFMEAFLAGGADGSRTQGAIATTAYVAAIADGRPDQSVRAFNLFGDPAVALYDGTLAPAGGGANGGGGGGGGDGVSGGGGGCALSGSASGWGDAAVLLVLLLAALLRTGWRTAFRNGG